MRIKYISLQLPYFISMIKKFMNCISSNKFMVLLLELKVLKSIA